MKNIEKLKLFSIILIGLLLTQMIIPSWDSYLYADDLEKDENKKYTFEPDIKEEDGSKSVKVTIEKKVHAGDRIKVKFEYNVYEIKLQEGITYIEYDENSRYHTFHVENDLNNLEIEMFYSEKMKNPYIMDKKVKVIM